MARDRTTRWLLACGVAGPALFVPGFLIEGAIRPDYDAARVFVSQLSLGDHGWLQIANFVVSGLLIIAFAFGLRRSVRQGPGSRWGPIMVGLGLVVSGVFVTDPALGYPPGTPAGLTKEPSWHGSVHLLGALFVFGGLPLGCFTFARRFRWAGDSTWANYSLLSGVAMFVVFIVANAGANGVGGLDQLAGWLQRISIAIGFAWIVLLALRFVREPATTAVA